MSNSTWPLWEVFIRSKQGLNHKHVGSLRAPDATLALENARDVYTRRSEGISIWVVESANIHATDIDEVWLLNIALEPLTANDPVIETLPVNT